MWLYVRFCLLAVSMTGYFLYVTKKYQIRLEFAPALFCAWSSNLLFVGGILNFLPHIVWLILAGGYVCFAISVKNKYKFNKREIMLYVCFFALLIYFLWMMRNARFTSYDNFSHWATVVKDMLYTDRMPNFEDTVIRFQSYPLGSSLFVYAVCKVIGTAEGCFLLAQVLMLVSFLFCMAVFITKKNWYAIIFIVLYGVWALTANNSIYELRVDTLLPAAGVAAWAMIYYYKEKPLRAVYHCTGLFILLVNIKNSGIFFFAACLIFLAVYARGHRLWSKIGIFSTALPILTMLIWKRHVALIFPDGLQTKHAMSLEHYEQMLAKKSLGDIVQIGQKILARLVTWENIEVKVLLMLLLLLGIFMAVLFLNHKPVQGMLRIAAIDLGCFFAYIALTFGMYIFSMPIGEAQHLASYDRYILSVLIFIYGMTVIFMVQEMQALEPLGFAIRTGRLCMPCPLGMAAAVLVAAAIIWPGRANVQLLYQTPDFTKTKRCALQEQLRENGIKEGDSCLVNCDGSDYDARYLFYLTRYELWNADVTVVRTANSKKYGKQDGGHDFIISFSY